MQPHVRYESGACTMTEDKPKDQKNRDERNEPFERFENLTKKLLRVPKEEADEQRRKDERERKQAG